MLAIRPIDFFRASEHIDETHVRVLAVGIEAAGIWTAPLPVEAGSGFIMDGNHRLAVARRLNLRCLPTAIGRQELLPFKSTRHLFNPPLPGSEIPLALLRDGVAR